MWWVKKRAGFGEQIRKLNHGSVLDEHTFWQIVRTEKERADRSGVPVTVAIFTVNDDPNFAAIAGWNASTLCSALKSTARLTDHVGVAGANEVGAILWGTRELGAYRFVNRLGEKANSLASECKLFVYPTLKGEHARPKTSQHKNNDDDAPASGLPSDYDLLDRIADVEQKLAEAQDVETPVCLEDDYPEQGETFGFGSQPCDSDSPPNFASRFSNELNSGSIATLTPTRRNIDSVIKTAGLEHRAPAPEQLSQCKLDDKLRAKLSMTLEPLENLFLMPHPRWKRGVDILASAFGLVALSPVLATVAGLVKLTSPGPVLFCQTREGHGGKLFTIYKFRTMRIGADAEKAQLRANNEQHGPAFKMEHDPRITPIGRILRKTCLDELPQLWNILKGNMALVGPRPLDHRESSQIARWGRRRSHVMPGLTCIWQVHGKSKVTFNEWMRMDIRYSQKVSFWQDIKLVLATLKQVVLRKASH